MSSNRINICTWIYCDSDQEESLYPQVGGNSSSLKFQEVYWKCVVVFFATSVRNNPNANHILFTNTHIIQAINDFEIKQFLAEKNVKVVQLPLTYRTPDGYFGAWKNQFYIFDILIYINAICEEDAQYIILDSDCIWIKPVENISQAIDRYGLLTMVADNENDPNFKMNGISRMDMKLIYKELGTGKLKDAPHYYGGEIFAARSSEIKRVVKEINEVWNISIDRFKEGKLKFNEEAHMLSYIYFKLGYHHRTGNEFVKRIWTKLLGYNNVDGTERELTVWHLPTEKKLGIKRLFNQVIDMNSLFWKIPAGGSLITYIQRSVGLPKRNFLKFTLDVFDSTCSKVGIKLINRK